MPSRTKSRRPVRMTEELKFCRIMELPKSKLKKAAATAYKVNPANGLPSGAGRKLGLSPERLIVLVNKMWSPKGVDRTVSFVDEDDRRLIDKILTYMNKWGEYANVRYRYVPSGGVTRIALRQNMGYASFLGTDILQIPANQPTMWLSGFTLNTPESEYNRVIPHEAGHDLGFPHEHERQEIIDELDVEKVVALYKARYGWDRETTMSQVFEPLNPNSIRATAPDTRGVMCYPFPASVTKRGIEIPGGTGIDEIDGKFIATLYPKPDTPQPPTGTGLAAENFQLSLSLNLSGGQLVAQTPAGSPIVASVSRRKL